MLKQNVTYCSVSAKQKSIIVSYPMGILPGTQLDRGTCNAGCMGEQHARYVTSPCEKGLLSWTLNMLCLSTSGGAWKHNRYKWRIGPALITDAKTR